MKGPTLKVSGPVAEVAASDGGVVLNIPITLKRRSGRRVVAVDSSGSESSPRTRTGSTPLQLALARGTAGCRCWRPERWPQ